MNIDVVSNSAEETIEFGRRAGSQLKGGEVIAICGTLGSGKTHLIKGIAEGAGAAESKKVTSPTFVIINEYIRLRQGYDGQEGRLEIYHIDAYRLESMAEFEMLGFDDYCQPWSVVLIEWADKVEAALKNVDYVRVELSHAGESKRKIHIENLPEYIEQ
ncbi:MAG: tRNA (adenosine(37)-N6)-threonylcarbamoyltransferase complex ATPase subunit type 1 TsaE [Sedimentisphaerales bacterium]|nr:tRNA (adenosine(37)-N6)-threonylcarbamoyltransferase complex ATPase subunit type 1 TsaE [Sedimentisphaerales bacterium]